MDVELNPPPIGTRHTPIRLAGRATIDTDQNGLRIRAAWAKSGGSKMALVALGSVAVVAVMIALSISLKLPTEMAVGVAVAAIGALFTFAKRNKTEAAGVPETHIFPWKNVKEIKFDPSSKCIVVVIKKMKPKGGIYINAGPNSDVERALGKAHRAYLLAEQNAGRLI